MVLFAIKYDWRHCSRLLGNLHCTPELSNFQYLRFLEVEVDDVLVELVVDFSTETALFERLLCLDCSAPICKYNCITRRYFKVIVNHCRILNFESQPYVLTQFFYYSRYRKWQFNHQLSTFKNQKFNNFSLVKHTWEIDVKQTLKTPGFQDTPKVLKLLKVYQGAHRES